MVVQNFGIKDISCILHCNRGNNIRKWRQMSDTHDSPKMKEAFSACCAFKGDPRGTGLWTCLDGLKPWRKKQGKLLNVTYCFGTIEFAKSYKVQFCQSHSCWYNSQSGVGKRAKTSLLVPWSACWWNFVCLDAKSMTHTKMRHSILL